MILFSNLKKHSLTQNIIEEKRKIGILFNDQV